MITAGEENTTGMTWYWRRVENRVIDCPGFPVSSATRARAALPA